MKKIFVFSFILASAFFIAGCHDGKTGKSSGKDSVVSLVKDTAVYGKCGEGTMMSTLELITDDGKTMTFDCSQDEDGSLVMGGLLAGDKMALTYFKTEEGLVATKVINLTTLLGRWTSIDRNFTIQEDGSVVSSQQAESNPYTSWSTINGRLVLNSDTFDIISLGSDSLSIENNKGLFVYKRQSEVNKSETKE